MKLEEIGFYTLSDKRAQCSDHTTDLSRCEIVLTARCNFSCPYCRSVGGKDMSYEDAKAIVRRWTMQGLKNIRFSGGEPTLWKGLTDLVEYARSRGVERIAISSNGSASQEQYQELIDAGVNDFSISLDACCAEDGDKMAGGIKGVFNTIAENIAWLSDRVYTTVGVVLTEENVDTINNIIRFADDLGVSDIRVIPAAQDGSRLQDVQVDIDLMEKYKILAYRVNNMIAGKPVRGLSASDSSKCGLALDDMAVMGDSHYPCIIYMRELGKPIGKICSTFREDRLEWYKNHDTKADPICSKNCLDVCVHYNNTHHMKDD